MKTIKNFGIIILLITMFTNCSSDDTPIEEQIESFRIKAVSIIAESFPDTEGDALELYGRISFSTRKDGQSEQFVLWDRTRDSFESVGEQPYLINSEGSERNVTFTLDQLQDGAEFLFYAEMFDRDPDGNIDDYLGNELRGQFVRVFAAVSDENNPVLFDFRLREFDGVYVRVQFLVEHVRE